MNIEKLGRVAIDEIQSLTFELTKQFLKVNMVLKEDEVPVIADIIVKEEENTGEVYFPIVDESYYFVVYLDLKPSPAVRFMGMSAGNSVQLFVSSENHTTDELISILGLIPTKKWDKGEKRARSNANVFYNFSALIFEPVEKRTGEVEDKLKELIDLLIPYKEKVLELTKIASVEVQIAYYGYKDQMWGINLDSKTIARLAELNLPVDVDIYASGPDLDCEE